MKDYYQILGVARTANADEIKTAYRKLASQHHPDKGGDTARFQEIQQAYETLGDPAKRQQYDNPRPEINFGNMGGFDVHDIFSTMFGQGRPQSRRGPGYVRMSLWISLRDVATGGTRTVNLGTSQGQSTVEIEIPKGINDGDSVQYSGIGPGNADLVVNFRVHPESGWERHGLNLITEQKVNVWDLILGSSVEVTNLIGVKLSTQIPPGCQPGTLLRLRNQGLSDRNNQIGDLFVRVVPFLSTQIAPEIREAIEKYR